MNKSRCGLTLPEFLTSLVVVVSLVIFFTGVCTFTGFACLSVLAAGFIALAVLVALKKGRRAFVIATIPGIACIVLICVMLPTVFPMHFARLRGVTYANAPLASVLSDIAGQKDDRPYWRFHISDRNLAQRPVTIEIPNGCRLGRAIELIKAEAGCEYAWYWHKVCGNEPSPLCAVICFFPFERARENLWDSEVIVDRHSVYYPREQAEVAGPPP